MNGDEIKQAVREVLLSEEFLKAFAAAWQKTTLIDQSEMEFVAFNTISISDKVKHYSNEVKKYER